MRAVCLGFRPQKIVSLDPFAAQLRQSARSEERECFSIFFEEFECAVPNQKESIRCEAKNARE